MPPSKPTKEKSPSNDPTHSAEVGVAVKQSISELGIPGKMFFAVQMLLVGFLVLIPQAVLGKVGLRSNKKSFKLKRVITHPEVYVGKYVMPVGSSNVVVIKGKDGKVFLRSPPEPLPEIVAQITAVGEPGAILISQAHDTFAGKWKELYPNAIILAQDKDIPIINNRVQVDMKLDDASELLKNYYITRFLSASDFIRFEDVVLLIELPNNRVAASLSCGFMNEPASIWNPLTWHYFIVGMAPGPRFNRLFSFLFIRDFNKASAFWKELAKVPGLMALIFLHGETIISEDVPQLLATARPCPEIAPFKRG